MMIQIYELSFNPATEKDEVTEIVIKADHLDAIKEMREAGQILFESHCLNAGHSQAQTCPVCVKARAALARKD